MNKDIADMAAAIEQVFAADPICGGRFCSGTAEAAARAAYAVVQARVERLEAALTELTRRFDRRDWVLSGDDSKALHHARAVLNPRQNDGDGE